MVRDWRALDAFRNAVEKACGLPVRNYAQALTDPTDFGDFMHPQPKRRATLYRFVDKRRRNG